MPFTPFHFGVGLAVKAAVPRGFHLAFFIVLQVAIDLESLYNLAHDRYPVHRFLHTFVGATLLAVLSSALVLPIMLHWRAATKRTGRDALTAGRAFVSLLLTALFATWSHVVLDGIMHRDVQPFWPISSGNPLLGIVGVSRLHLACLVLGFFGAVFLAFQATLNNRSRR